MPTPMPTRNAVMVSATPAVDVPRSLATVGRAGMYRSIAAGPRMATPPRTATMTPTR